MPQMVDKKNERLHKWIAKNGEISRRRAETYIQEGRVQLNGATVTKMGVLIDPDKDEILLDGKKLHIQETKVWIALNKPKNTVTTKSDPENRTKVLDLIPKYPYVHPVGRLDFESEGLILLTNDGEGTYYLTHPKFEVLKKYEVAIVGALSDDIKKKLLSGVHLKDGIGQLTALQILKKTKKNTVLLISVTEGRNRFIRRMLGYFDLEVLKLKRIQMGPIHLKNLKPGEHRLLSKSEIFNINKIKKEK